MEGVTTTWLG